MKQIKGFWNEHKVFILGLISAIVVVLQQYVHAEGRPDIKVIGFAVFIAVLSYLAKSWRGQTTSILGLVGMLAGVFVTEWQTGNFTWFQFAVQAVIAWQATQTPDAKSRGYEHAAPIVEAKKEGEAIVPAPLTAKPE